MRRGHGFPAAQSRVMRSWNVIKKPRTKSSQLVSKQIEILHSPEGGPRLAAVCEDAGLTDKPELQLQTFFLDVPPWICWVEGGHYPFHSADVLRRLPASP